MKLLCSGDRKWPHLRPVIEVLEKYKPEKVIVGDATGLDEMVRIQCEIRGIDFEVHKADWKQHRRGAGPIRNRQMLDQNPDLLVAFHNDIRNSKGTKNCVRQALSQGVTVMLVTTEDGFTSVQPLTKEEDTYGEEDVENRRGIDTGRVDG